MSKILEFLKGMVPTLKFIAGLTSTDVDDKLVAILEGLVANPSKVAQVHESMRQQGAL